MDIKVKDKLQWGHDLGSRGDVLCLFHECPPFHFNGATRLFLVETDGGTATKYAAEKLQWGHETKSRGDVYGLLQYGIVQGFNGATRLNLVETAWKKSK